VRHEQCVAFVDQVAQLLTRLRFADDGADGHRYVEIFATAAGAAIARARLAVLSLVGSLDAEIRERVDARRRPQIDAAAVAAVAAIRPAERNEFFAPKARAAAAAVAGLHLESCFVDEFHGSGPNRHPRESGDPVKEDFSAGPPPAQG
jgi:hypothetical protein